MFNKRARLDEQLSLVKHKGIFRRRITMFQGVALIVSSTIGAGVLGIPYAVSKVGLIVGMIYIFCLGGLMIGYNLLIGAIAVRTKGDLQLVGLSRKYLGKFGEAIMIVLKYVSGAGISVIYIIGVGYTLSVLLGGSSFMWSIIFIIIGFLIINRGIRTIKVIDFFLSLIILFIILLIAGFSATHIEAVNFNYSDLSKLLLPYGVILFAFHGSAAVLEAHSILTDRQKSFRSSIIIAGLINIIAYALFTLVVLGVTGLETTEIATIGLGSKIGPIMLIFGNVFAVLAMGTSFLNSGLALRDSLVWDYKMNERLAVALICIFPTIIFLLGLRQFIAAISIVGGIFVSLEMMLVILIYWRAKQTGDIRPSKYKLHHTLLLVVLLIVALIIGASYSVINLF